MRFPTKEERNTDFPKLPPLEADYYEAKCFLIAYIGTQTFIGQRGPFKVQKVYFGFELENEKYEGGKPRTIYMDVKASLVEGSELRNIMNNWFGREGKPFDDERADNFDFKVVVKNGIRGRLNVSKYLGNDKKYYNKVDNIMPTKMASNLSTPTNALVIFDANKPVKEEYDKLPKFIKSKIQTTKEWDETAVLFGLAVAPQPKQEPVTVTVTKEIQKEFAGNEPTPSEKEIIASSSSDEDDLPF